MNTDQVKGTVKEVAGKVQARVGTVVGSTEQQAKGHIRQAEGKAQHIVGDAKVANDTTRKP